MAKGYWVVRMDVHDPEKYVSEYASKNGPSIKAFGGKYLVRGGQYEVIEGTARQRSVVIEFPSYQAALDCMKSPEYAALAEIRHQYGSGDVIVVEGYDAPESGQ